MLTMPGKFTLNKKQRLKSRKSIEDLFASGKTISSGSCKAFYKSFPGNLQMGAGVSTKNFKRAVDRNRIKRLIRECWRLQKNSLEEKLGENGLNVFILYTGKELPEYKTVYGNIGALLEKLQKIKG